MLGFVLHERASLYLGVVDFERTPLAPPTAETCIGPRNLLLAFFFLGEGFLTTTKEATLLLLLLFIFVFKLQIFIFIYNIYIYIFVKKLGYYLLGKNNFLIYKIVVSRCFFEKAAHFK